MEKIEILSKKFQFEVHFNFLVEIPKMQLNLHAYILKEKMYTGNRNLIIFSTEVFKAIEINEITLRESIKRRMGSLVLNG